MYISWNYIAVNCVKYSANQLAKFDEMFVKTHRKTNQTEIIFVAILPVKCLNPFFTYSQKFNVAKSSTSIFSMFNSNKKRSKTSTCWIKNKNLPKTDIHLMKSLIITATQMKTDTVFFFSTSLYAIQCVKFNKHRFQINLLILIYVHIFPFK